MRIIGAMKFINFVKYRDLDKIASARPAHFAYADRLRAQGKLAIGGPLMDDQGRRIGLLFIYEAVSKDEALSFAQQDPFTVANALSSYEISGWRLRGANLELLIKANRSADQSGGENTQIRLFANYAKYAADKSRLATVRPAHWEYDRTLKNAGKLALAGPFADDEGGLVCLQRGQQRAKRCPISSKIHSHSTACSQIANSSNGSLRASILICSPSISPLRRSEGAVLERELLKP